MSLWDKKQLRNLTKMPAASDPNPLDMFTSCAISNISVQDAIIHTLYRPAHSGVNDIILVFIHGYPQTHIMWRSVCPCLTTADIDVCFTAKGNGCCLDGHARLRTEYKTSQKFIRGLLQKGNWGRPICCISAVTPQG